MLESAYAMGYATQSLQPEARSPSELAQMQHPGSTHDEPAFLFETSGQETSSRKPWTSTIPDYFGGALLALVVHESGHWVLGESFNARPYLKRVETAGIPFFAVGYRKAYNHRKQYAISSAGLWMQHGMAEVILARHPHLWQENAPGAQGAFMFHLATSLIYGYAALAKSGPPERDTFGMSQGLGINERWVGVAILAPALLDLYRSFFPDAAWARWSSRSIKVSFVFALTR